MLKTPIERPATSTILRSPGGISSALATVYLANLPDHQPHSERIECPSVLVEDLLLEFARQPYLERSIRIVEVPVRVVRGEHQHVVGTEVIDDLEKVLRVRRFLHRLGREPHLLPDVLRWRPLEERYFLAQTLPVLVEPPHERRQPGEATLHDHDAQTGEPLEDSLAHQADHLRLEGLGHDGVVLDVEGGPAGGRDRVAAKTGEMDAHGQSMALRRLVDFPVS